MVLAPALYLLISVPVIWGVGSCQVETVLATIPGVSDVMLMPFLYFLLILEGKTLLIGCWYCLIATTFTQ